MAVEVRLAHPAARRTPTAQASVSADGATVGEVFTELVGAVPGPPGQPPRRRRARCTSSSTSTRTTTTSGTSTSSTPRSPTATSSRSSPPSPAADARATAAVKMRVDPRPDREHAARRRARAVAEPGGAHLRQARGSEPGRLVEGPHRAEDDRARRAATACCSRARRSSSRRRATPASASRSSPSCAATGCAS